MLRILKTVLFGVLVLIVVAETIVPTLVMTAVSPKNGWEVIASNVRGIKAFMLSA